MSNYEILGKIITRCENLYVLELNIEKFVILIKKTHL